MFQDISFSDARVALFALSAYGSQYLEMFVTELVTDVSFAHILTKRIRPITLHCRGQVGRVDSVGIVLCLCVH